MPTPSFIQKIFRSIIGAAGVLLTGGKFGGSVPSKYRYEYGKAQEQKNKDFEKHGGHPCKICLTRIPGNKQYCGSCYYKYLAK